LIMNKEKINILKSFVNDNFDISSLDCFKDNNEVLIFSDNGSTVKFLKENNFFNRKIKKQFKKYIKDYKFSFDEKTLEIIYTTKTRKDFANAIINFLLNLLINKI